MVQTVERQVRACAKVNLWLHVGGRRPDGYHDIDTLMVGVSIYDDIRLSVAPAASSRVLCRVAGPEAVAPGGDNLAARAARAVLDELNERARVVIELYKRIPSGAGLGGGSSDAASVIRALPALLGRRLARDRSLELARRLGADVPFFLFGRPARATGIGERLRPAGWVPQSPVVVVVPARRVDTAWAYRNALPRLTSRKQPPSFRRFSLRDGGLEALLHNEFERRVGRAVPDVRRISRALVTTGAHATIMSGSGSAVVGFYRDSGSARSAASSFEHPDVAFAARLLRGAPRARVGRSPSW